MKNKIAKKKTKKGLKHEKTGKNGERKKVNSMSA